MPKIALIIGITGQDGSYLAEFLLGKGYEVHGLKRRTSLFNTGRIDHLYRDPHHTPKGLQLHFGDLTDMGSLMTVLKEVRPDEIYNLGAMSHVKVSFDVPEYTANVDGLGTLRLLEAIRLLDMGNKVKVFQASTSELYGKTPAKVQDESTPFHPQSPYAVAKLFGFWSVVNYREAYGIYACNGILFNHESPVRGETFVTRKITRGLAQIVHGFEDRLYLGNLNARRDWGHARDYVEAMWLMLQQDRADDYVIATGESHSIRNFLELCLRHIGIEVKFVGEGKEEKCIVTACHGPYLLPVGKVIVEIDPYYFRPNEVEALCGDASKARTKLGWKPKHDLDALIRDMMDTDLKEFSRQRYLCDGGFPKERGGGYD